MKSKVSFDYDGTLTNPKVREYARELIKRGYDVWIVTSRSNNPMARENKDLFETAKSVGIKIRNILFLPNGKEDIIIHSGFKFHLDDSIMVVKIINHSGDKGVLFAAWSDSWRNECESKLK